MASEVPSCVWLDVQPLLTAAAAQLDKGEMLHGPSFSLSGVMSAVEIGDPKLDAGLEQNKLRDATSRVEPPTNLTGPQILAIMDHLAVMEATWHAGNSLAQTVFTCHYLLNPSRIEHIISLSAFCKGVQASTEDVRALVLSGSVCEEEDFMPYMLWLSNQPSTEDSRAKALAALTLADEQMSAQLQGSRRDEPEGLLKAMLCRVRFRKALLQAIQKLQIQTRQGLDNARKQLTLAAAELERIQESASLAAEHAEGFDPDANRHLMGAAPPRAITLMTQQANWEYYAQLVQQLLGVCDVYKVTTWQELKRFLGDFAAALPCAVARSAMSRALQGGSNAPAWAPEAPMVRAALGLPPDQDLGPEVATLVEQAVIAVSGWSRVMCLNRARQRRRHRRGVSDWGHLFHHAANADASPTFQGWMEQTAWRQPPPESNRAEEQGPLALWAEKECSQVMLQHLLLGFELETYAPQEYCMLYWYCDYLYGIVQENSHALAAGHPMEQPVQPKASKKGKDKKGAQPGGPRLRQPALDALQDAKEAGIERQLCQGLMRLAAGLTVAGAIPPQPAPFNSEEQRFEQRFATFHQITHPGPLVYADYAESMDTSEVPAPELLRSAMANFQSVRNQVRALPMAPVEGLYPPTMVAKFKVLERVAMQNAVALHLVASKLKDRPSSRIKGAQVADGGSKQEEKIEHAAGNESVGGEEAVGSGATGTRSKQENGVEVAVSSDSTQRRGGDELTSQAGTGFDSNAVNVTQKGGYELDWQVHWDFSHHLQYPVVGLKHVRTKPAS